MIHEESLWRVVFIARESRAESAEHRLTEEGFLVRRRESVGASSRSEALVELLVLKSEADEARAFLTENVL